MKRLLLVPALTCGLFLGSCATTQQEVSNIINDVEQATNTLCGFLPGITTIQQILSATNPAIATAEMIANSICAVVASIPPSKLSAVLRGAIQEPTVAGVPIHGTYTRGPNAGRSL